MFMPSDTVLGPPLFLHENASAMWRSCRSKYPQFPKRRVYSVALSELRFTLQYWPIFFEPVMPDVEPFLH